ncbi:MAG: phosphoenolpyruvate carboxylase, partial [Gammaproteobacteria bacterium]|nr:phosphoenolpyruvate carboxylase [Gammaproteobacteria bacterium]
MYRQSIQFPAKDAGLREDVHELGALIGETLRDQGGEEFFRLVEGDRVAALERRQTERGAGGFGVPAHSAAHERSSGPGAPGYCAPGYGAPGHPAAGVDELQRRTEDRPPSLATDLTRAFSIWFQAVNTAEKVHRVRRRRQYLNDSKTVQPGGIADCIARLQREGATLEKMLELIASMSIEPVFTAHPTESTRRTILRKQQRIAQDLLDRLNPGLSRAEYGTLWARVRLEITSIWQTEDHPREGLTVADEREHVLFYLLEILYRVVPLFY